MREKGWREMRGKNIKELKLEQKIKNKQFSFSKEKKHVAMLQKRGGTEFSHHNLFFLRRIRMKQCSFDWSDQRFDPLKDPSVRPSVRPALAPQEV